MASTDPSGAPSLLYASKRLELAIRAHLDEALRGSGVTTLQYTALTVLHHRDGVSAAKLARHSFVTPQSMADMLRALEERGLTARTPNPDSGRELLVHLTGAGRAFIDRQVEAAAAIESRMIAGFTPAQAEAFRTALESAWSNLKDGPGAGGPPGKQQDQEPGP